MKMTCFLSSSAFPALEMIPDGIKSMSERGFSFTQQPQLILMWWVSEGIYFEEMSFPVCCITDDLRLSASINIKP